MVTFEKKRTTMKKQTTPKIITDLKQYLTPCNKFLYRNTIMSIWRLVLNCKCACARAPTIVRMHCTHTQTYNSSHANSLKSILIAMCGVQDSVYCSLSSSKAPQKHSKAIFTVPFDKTSKPKN